MPCKGRHLYINIQRSIVFIDISFQLISMARNEKTSKKVAAKAGALLRNSKSKKVKSVAASALTQVADKKKKKGAKK